MTRKLFMIAMVGAAGAAHAAPELQIVSEELGGVQVEADFGSDSDFAFDADFALANPREYSISRASTPDLLGPGIDEVRSSASMTSAFSSTGLSISSVMSGAVVTNDTYDGTNPADRASAYATVQHEATILLTEDASVRIRVNGLVDTSFANTEYRHEVVFSGESLALTSIGTEDGSSALPPFDVTLDLQAGEYSYEFIQYIGDSGFPNSDGYYWDSTLDFSFEIVPAPSAAGLFGLAGLTAARRRR